MGCYWSLQNVQRVTRRKSHESLKIFCFKIPSTLPIVGLPLRLGLKGKSNSKMKGMFKKAPEALNQNSYDSSKVGANPSPTILKRHPQMSCLCEGAAGTRSRCALLGDVTVSPVV